MIWYRVNVKWSKSQLVPSMPSPWSLFSINKQGTENNKSNSNVVDSMLMSRVLKSGKWRPSVNPSSMSLLTILYELQFSLPVCTTLLYDFPAIFIFVSLQEIYPCFHEMLKGTSDILKTGVDGKRNKKAIPTNKKYHLIPNIIRWSGANLHANAKRYYLLS